MQTQATNRDLDGPVISPPESQPPVNTDLLQRFNQSLEDTEERLDSAIASLSRANLLRQRLEENINVLEVEQRRTAR